MRRIQLINIVLSIAFIVTFALVCVGAVLAQNAEYDGNWFQSNTSTLRSYSAYGARFTIIAEQTADDANVYQVHAAQFTTNGSGVHGGTVNWIADRACWQIRLISDDPALHKVWSDPACEYRVFLPLIRRYSARGLLP